MRELLNQFAASELTNLIHRLELLPVLLRGQQEEAIADLVDCSESELIEEEKVVLGGQSRAEYIQARNWLEADMDLKVRCCLALKLYAKQHYGPGLEDVFLRSHGKRDKVIYSMLRVKERGLARELYLRIMEGEITFPDASSQFGQGPEAQYKGVLGPMPIGSIYPPVISDWLRSLKPGEVKPPEHLGEWHFIMRLEQLTPARLDDPMRQTLLDEQMNEFLDDRVKRLLKGDIIDPLHYHQLSKPGEEEKS